jgi:hypothetical protein
MCLRVTTGYVQQGGAGRIVVYRVTGNPRFIAHYAVGHRSGPGGEEHVLIPHDKPPSFLMVTSLATTAPTVPAPFGVHGLSLGIHEDFTTV